MRITFLALILSSTIACAQHDIGKVEWLTGTWVRTNPKPGKSAVETWKKKSSSELTGYAASLTGADTTYTERIRIFLKDGKLFYVADVPENKAEIWFEFTSITDNGFVCENPKHDFPKKITYQLNGKDLKATISGDGKAIDYLFVKRD
jgi:hypothetical protein